MASFIRFSKNVNGYESLPESNFGLVLEKNGHNGTSLMSNRARGVILERPNISLIIAPSGSE